MSNTPLAGQQVWLTYVDEEDGCDSESWSVFYVEPTVTTSEALAIKAGQAEISRRIAEDPEMDPSDFHAEIVGPLTIDGAFQVK